MRIKIEIAEAESKRNEIVDMAAGGATVGQIVESAGIDPKDKDFTVLGKPAKLDTRVTPADARVADEKCIAVLGVSARPQGS